MTTDLSTLERKVERARAKLAQDLATLRSPQPYRHFTAGLKSEAQSSFQRFLDDLKSRAAANPTAALAIGAGVAWRLVTHPPIATALVGAGLFSLWRTPSVPVRDNDYLHEAQHRLGEQVSEAAVATGQIISEYAERATEGLRDLAGVAVTSAGESFDSLGETAKGLYTTGEVAVKRATGEIRQHIQREDFRDQLLLGVAGLAVMAALKIAYQNRGENGPH